MILFFLQLIASSLTGSFTIYSSISASVPVRAHEEKSSTKSASELCHELFITGRSGCGDGSPLLETR